MQPRTVGGAARAVTAGQLIMPERKDRFFRIIAADRSGVAKRAAWEIAGPRTQLFRICHVIKTYGDKASRM